MTAVIYMTSVVRILYQHLSSPLGPGEIVEIKIFMTKILARRAAESTKSQRV